MAKGKKLKIEDASDVEEREDAIHLDIPPYPTLAHAVASAPTVLNQITGKIDNLNEAIHCAYTIVGYGASVMFPHDHPAEGFAKAMNAFECPCPDDKSGCDALVQVTAFRAPSDSEGVLDVLLPILLPYVTKWLIEWLTKRRA